MLFAMPVDSAERSVFYPSGGINRSAVTHRAVESVFKSGTDKDEEKGDPGLTFFVVPELKLPGPCVDTLGATSSQSLLHLGLPSAPAGTLDNVNLRQFINIRTLNLRSCDLIDTIAEELICLPHLKTLSLAHNPRLTDLVLEWLPAESLRHLDLTECVGMRSFAELARLTRLRTLIMHDNVVCDADVRAVSKLSHLTFLTIGIGKSRFPGAVHVTSAVLIDCFNQLTDLEVVWLINLFCTHETLSAIAQHGNLRDLRLENVPLGSGMIELLRPLGNSLERLWVSVLGGCTAWESAPAYPHFRRLTKLQTICFVFWCDPIGAVLPAGDRPGLLREHVFLGDRHDHIWKHCPPVNFVNHWNG